MQNSILAAHPSRRTQYDKRLYRYQRGCKKTPLTKKLIDISDPVYTFCEVMDHIGLSKYFVEKGCKTGRPRCDEQKLLKVILFAFMENGACSLREIEKLCRNEIRYMYLLDEMKAPTFATFGNLIRKELTDSIEQIFMDINSAC